MDAGTYNRIAVVGCSGSGKSWLSKKLAEITGLPLVHLDCEYWQPGWVKTPRDEWLKKQAEMTAGDAWIIDGNYNSTLDVRFTAADMVIFLDISRFVCILSVLRRHGKKRSDLPDYLEEKLDSEFFDFIKWVWSFPKTGRATILSLHEAHPEIPFIVIKSRHGVGEFLASVRGRND
jgi:Adenylate kinase and related kinases